MAARGPDADIWGEDGNARRYEAFAGRHPIYRDTSRDLVALARSQIPTSPTTAPPPSALCGR